MFHILQIVGADIVSRRLAHGNRHIEGHIIAALPDPPVERVIYGAVKIDYVICHAIVGMTVLSV